MTSANRPFEIPKPQAGDGFTKFPEPARDKASKNPFNFLFMLIIGIAVYIVGVSAYYVFLGLPVPKDLQSKDFGDVLMAGEAARAKLREQEAKASPIQSQFDRDGAEFTKILGMSYGMTIYYKFDKQPFGYVKDFNWSKVEIVSLNDGSATWYDRSFISANYVTKK